MFTWIVDTGDKMKLHDMRQGICVDDTVCPPQSSFRAHPSPLQFRKAGNPVGPRIDHQIRTGDKVKWEAPPGVRLQTCLVPRGVMTLVVPSRVPRGEVSMVDILTDAEVGNVTLLWSRGLHTGVLDARNRRGRRTHTEHP